MTQTKLGQAIGKSQPYISDLKKGDRDGTIETWTAIAEQFKKSFKEFYDFGENLSPPQLSAPIIPSTPQPQPCPTCAHIHDEIIKKHFDIVTKFRNKELAAKINELMVRLEELEGDASLEMLKRQIEFTVKEAEAKANKKNGTNGSLES